MKVCLVSTWVVIRNVWAISWQDLMDMGRINPGDAGERFCMSTFACNTCQEVNGVSWLHGKSISGDVLRYLERLFPRRKPC